MKLPFHKMQAQGNDFVVINGLEVELPELTESAVKSMTERRFGIGCDQLLVLEADERTDARMRIYNNDGTEALNCGNGLRCVGHLLMRYFDKDIVSIALHDRQVHASRGSANEICVEMGKATIEHETEAHIDISIGNPHSVYFEATEAFPSNRNIEIITGQIADHIYIDIIERGAGRTLACGSGACAVAVAVWKKEKHHRPLTIEMPGGTVTVSGSAENIWLTGSVHTVFSGIYQL
ncbi:MAG: diaminopimelate epimerase [Zetaproteobacteria bacterium CG1_02_49_23]|nr:MAG: diaminopimelate epimerase [Zetaproteobacteria bacterium CG1_02_49_23]